jgi:hypothetical protein
VDLLASTINSFNRRADSHVQLESIPQQIRRNDKQLVPFRNFAADVVGKSAICERYVWTSLDQDDLGIF